MSQEGERAELAAERDRLGDALQAIQLRMSSLSAALPASPACRAQPHAAPDAVRRERRLSGDPVYQPLLLCPPKICSYAWDARPCPVIRMEAVLLRRLHMQLQAAVLSWQPPHVRAQRLQHRVSRCAISDAPCCFQMASSICLAQHMGFRVRSRWHPSCGQRPRPGMQRGGFRCHRCRRRPHRWALCWALSPHLRLQRSTASCRLPRPGAGSIPAAMVPAFGALRVVTVAFYALARKQRCQRCTALVIMQPMCLLRLKPGSQDVHRHAAYPVSYCNLWLQQVRFAANCAPRLTS